MRNSNQIYDELNKILGNYSNILFGISDTSFSEYSEKYKSAIVLAIPHNKILTLKNYHEENIEEIIDAAREKINIVLSDITIFMEYNNIQYLIPPVIASDETLTVPFSYKFAAVNSGLGWIGKNGVLITKEYGPRVRLAVILVDCELPKGEPIIRSKCTDECNLCVKACPYNALMGKQWDINTRRDELINYKLCYEKRRRFIKISKRKNACGLCLVSCPIGVEK